MSFIFVLFCLVFFFIFFVLFWCDFIWIFICYSIVVLHVLCELNMDGRDRETLKSPHKRNHRWQSRKSLKMITANKIKHTRTHGQLALESLETLSKKSWSGQEPQWKQIQNGIHMINIDDINYLFFEVFYSVRCNLLYAQRTNNQHE